jgi:hypothetical protein
MIDETHLLENVDHKIDRHICLKKLIDYKRSTHLFENKIDRQNRSTHFARKGSFGPAAVLSASPQSCAWPATAARTPTSLVPTFSTRVRIRNVSSTGGMPTIGELQQLQRTGGSGAVLRSKSMYARRRRDSAAPAEAAAGRPGLPVRFDKRKPAASPGVVNGSPPTVFQSFFLFPL